MTNELNIELPLYDAFIQLMRLETNQPNKGIDPDSYLELIDLLHRGYGLNSKEELLFICKKIWLKPFHKGEDAVINEVKLTKIINDNLEAYAIQIEEETKRPGDRQPAPIEPIENINQENETPAVQDDEEEDTNESIQENNDQPEETTVNTVSGRSTRLVINIEEGRAEESFEQGDYSNYFNEKKFTFNYTYLPVSARYIEQTIRSLRYKVKGTGRPVIDIEATVKDVSSKGRFDKWLLREDEDFVTRWTMLFDREGSMIAFHSVQDALADAAFRGTMKNEGDLFYFRNIVRDYLYTNKQRTRSVRFQQIAEGPRRNILIVSDAGAARGSFNEDRVHHTRTMLHDLRKHRVAWLNPLPKERWKNSSASFISEFVNMFEPGGEYADNLGNIVGLFKSKIITPIK